MSWWIWILAGLALLAVEFASASMHLGFFSIGAFVVAALVGFGVELPLWGQLAIFTGVSLLAFVFIRPILVRRLKLDFKPNVDPMIGEQAFPLEDIGVQQVGRAEMRGTTWSARNVGETMLTRGQRCVVASIDGLMLGIKAS